MIKAYVVCFDHLLEDLEDLFVVFEAILLLGDLGEDLLVGRAAEVCDLFVLFDDARALETDVVVDLSRFFVEAVDGAL